MLNTSPSQKTPIVVFSILAAHVLILLGLLIPGGCQKSEAPSDVSLAGDEADSAFGLNESGDQMDILLGVEGEPIPDLTNSDPVDESISEESDSTEAESNIAALEEETTTADSAGAASYQTSPQYDEYVVVKGDNYSTIIRKFNGLRVSDLQQANPDVNPTRIQIGQTLRIPRAALAVNREKSSTATQASVGNSVSSGKVYKIQSGDTLSKVASLYENVTVADIQSANPNLDPLRLQINQQIVIPEPKAVAAAEKPVVALKPGQKMYTISKGDNLFNIASSNGTSVREIQSANPNLDPRRLQLGSSIIIPAKSTTSEPSDVAKPAEEPMPGVYVVQAGDNLEKISKQLDVTVSELMQHNRLLTTRIKPGQELSVPKSAPEPDLMARGEKP